MAGLIHALDSSDIMHCIDLFSSVELFENLETANFASKKQNDWKKNKKQAINRFLAGRKLSKRTCARYGLTDQFLLELSSKIDFRKKWRYDRVAHLRRLKQGKVLSLKVCKKYKIEIKKKTVKKNVAHTEKQKKKNLHENFQNVLPFKKRRSARVRRLSVKYITIA